MFTVSVWDGDIMVFTARIDIVPNTYCVVHDVWVASETRGTGLFKKFLLFLKVQLKQKRIAFGEVHSDRTYELLKSGGFKLFKKYWENRGGDRKDFSTDTIDEFYGLGKWKLFLENSNDLSEYIREQSFTHSYTALVNIVDTHEKL